MIRPTRFTIAMALVLSACNSSDAPIVQPAPQPARLTTLTIADPGVVRDGDAVALVANVRDQNGAPMTTATVAWSVTDSAVATVSATGVLSALREGQTELVATATAGTVTLQQRRPLGVTLHPAVAIELAKQDMELPIGVAGGSAVTLRGLDGRVLLNRQVQWTSDNPAVADVSLGGIVTARQSGTARITARYGALTSTLVVTVPTPAPATISGTYFVATANGSPLSAVIEEELERTPTGQHGYITRMDSGTVTIGVGYQVTLHLSSYEYTETGGNVIIRRVGRTVVNDAGYVAYDAVTKQSLLASTRFGSLTHTAQLESGVPVVRFRQPGDNGFWALTLVSNSTR
jgi:hypothetical protein